jgi:NTE family protein
MRHRTFINEGATVMKFLSISLALLLLSGCASYGVIDNTPKKAAGPSDGYSIRSGGGSGWGSGDISLILAFSGGGTRAAALAYGVLEELRDTHIVIEGKRRRLLDETDIISSVSGGSFTSAYYGLYGDRIFEDYEDVFLRRNVQGQLIRGLLNPLEWFSRSGRTEMAVELYEKEVFHGATFQDMKREGSPLVLINASDLGYGVRFSFVQDYFNLLCSDISDYPVARAVTASSAVPILFEPVVVENYQNCKKEKPAWLIAAEKRAAGDPELSLAVAGLNSYFKKDRRQYAHFVDGGITDNLGLRALYEIIEISGGPKVFVEQKLDRKPPRRLVVISVNASTDPEPQMDVSNKQPSLKETISAMSDVQLHRYNVATLELMEKSVKRWARDLSSPGRPVKPYFIQVGFRDIQQPERQQFFNQVPTSFSLTDEQVDELIAAGRELLRHDPDFQRFLAGLDGTRAPGGL